MISIATTIDPSIEWIPLGEAYPGPVDALILKQSAADPMDGFIENWMGVVRGLYLGRSVSLLIFASPDDIKVAPMVENGVDRSACVTHWAPWPKVDVPAPAGAPVTPVLCRRCVKVRDRSTRA